jgi:N6-adenosine-specific RNA methylase IME4
MNILARNVTADPFAGPYLELFARQQRPGWTAWGNETTKFGDAA